jgi:SAM-dependent methyltransferase
MTTNRGPLRRLAECVRERRIPHVVSRVLASPAAAHFHRPILNSLLRLGTKRKPRPITYEQALELHRQYPKRDGYKYDMAAKEERASLRMEELAKFLDLSQVRDVAEVGAGDGRLALRLHNRGFRPQILDVADWRDDDVKAAGIPFHPLRGSGDYPLSDESVDLVVSYNAMEHIPDPAAALREMIRIVRPAGRIHLSFCPIYNSPWGLHAYRTFHAPYPQFLLDPADLDRFVAENGIDDLGRRREEFQFVNGWGCADYRAMVAAVRQAATCERFHRTRDLDHLGVVYHHLSSFRGRGLSFDELTTDYLEILLQKRIDNNRM